MAGASEIRAFEVTCPAQTPIDTPLIVNLDMPTRVVLNIRVRIPPGPNGKMHFAIGSTGTSVIPINDGEYITASDEIFNWDLVDQIDSGSWQAIMYNDGLYDHTIYITFTVQLPDAPGAAMTIQPVTIGAPAGLSTTLSTAPDFPTPAVAGVSEN